MTVIRKWIKSDGSYLTKSEYKSLSVSASKKNIPLEDFLSYYGVQPKYSTGYLQDPLSNSAELTYWVKNIKGKWMFLTKWKYKQFFEEAKRKNLSITEFLKSNNYFMWKDLFECDITSWVHKDTRLPLFRKDYITISNKTIKGESVSDVLNNLGYVRISDKKREY